MKVRKISNHLYDYERRLSLVGKEEKISDYALEKQELYRGDFYKYAIDCWAALEGVHVPFKDNWHIGCISELIMAIEMGQVRLLNINIPPRCMKSTLISVAFPSWKFGYQPWKKFLCATYVASLSIEHSLKCRDLINSSWYQEIFGNVFKLKADMNCKTKFATDQKGYRIATTVGSGTGFGGDYIIVDDGNSIEDMSSEASRMKVNNWWDRTAGNRLNDKATGVRIQIQHRMHTEDLTGHIMDTEDKDAVHLCLPMEFERARKCIIKLPGSKNIFWQDPRTKEGELLWPEKISRHDVELEKKRMGAYAYSGLYQQRPSPEHGSIFDLEWILEHTEEKLPEFLFKIQSWDTALVDKVDACKSAATTWGVFMNKWGLPCLMLLEVYEDHAEFPIIREMAKRMASNYHDIDFDNEANGHNRVDRVLIEAKVNGFSLLQELLPIGIPAIGFNPNPWGGKQARARATTPLVASGRVYIRRSARTGKLFKSAEKLLDALVNFPTGKNNDIVDSMTQVILYLKKIRTLDMEDYIQTDDVLPQYTSISSYE